jgi:hypothetical protein
VAVYVIMAALGVGENVKGDVGVNVLGVEDVKVHAK